MNGQTRARRVVWPFQSLLREAVLKGANSNYVIGCVDGNSTAETVAVGPPGNACCKA